LGRALLGGQEHRPSAPLPWHVQAGMCGYNWTRPVARPKSLWAACLLATGIGHSALDKDGALCLRRVPDPDPLTLLHSGPAAAPADTHDGARVSNESERGPAGKELAGGGGDLSLVFAQCAKV
jgi:hypothetical protein